MLRQLNIEGRITNDFELSKLPNGTSLTNFNIASNANKRDKNGDIITDFFRVTLFGKQAEFACSYLKKGYLVSVCGDFSIDKYVDKDGTQRTSYTINASNVYPLESKRAQQAIDGNTDDHKAYNSTSGYEETKTSADLDISADDLPFSSIY